MLWLGSKRMDAVRAGIRRCKDYERLIFGCRARPFAGSVRHYSNPLNPGKRNNNFFAKDGVFTAEEIQAAALAQQAQGLDYLQLETSKRLPAKRRRAFALREEAVLSLFLQGPGNFPVGNLPAYTVKDIQTDDIRRELLDVSDVPQEYRTQALINMEAVCRVAAAHPEYHWLLFYLDGRRAGAAYALSYEGFVECDDLYVVPACRNRGLGTAILHYVREHFPGILYLHVDADNRAGRLYERLGFRRAEKFYDYSAELR